MKRIARGDVSALTDAFRRHLQRVEQHLAETAPDLPPHALRDVAVIAGVSLTMLGVKVLKLLPGVPFAPGHKGVLLIPLYLVAGVMTRTASPSVRPSGGLSITRSVRSRPVAISTT